MVDRVNDRGPGRGLARRHRITVSMHEHSGGVQAAKCPVKVPVFGYA
jgi:hypothetical protein